MGSQTQGNTLQDILKWEQENHFSREAVTVLSGQNLSLGVVIGKITKSIPASGTPDSENSGAGTITSVTGGARTKPGTYTLTCKSYTASPLAAVIEVKDPDGNALPDAGIGGYSNAQINFTVADGSPVIAAGDIWTIEVAEGSGSVRALNPAGVDGSQEAHGFVIDDYDATDGALSGVAIARDAVIVADDLDWPTGITNDQKATALDQLAARGIVTRQEA
ncbi:Bacteriophage lambda head decoration protein D [Syntrophus gentianae]|uniref:Bacteriophage lambda head decoration protein D n=1 Tax=Syntrophus gentianae TaxID=43775 RepID=A0A1H8B7Y6_9BACT|nr:head decoration protein [Syntrophus gentianae]SEM78883.1 Bacteriophage lambda head decoration protein D [Syntrophus gentianae]